MQHNMQFNMQFNMQNNMQFNMQNNMQLLKSICRIVHCLYSAYSAYICTPHFADDIPGIYQVYTSKWYIPGIYQVYTG